MMARVMKFVARLVEGKLPVLRQRHLGIAVREQRQLLIGPDVSLECLGRRRTDMGLIAREIVDVIGPARFGREVCRCWDRCTSTAPYKNACVLPSARMGVSLIGRGTSSGRSTACTSRTSS